MLIETIIRGGMLMVTMAIGLVVVTVAIHGVGFSAPLALLLLALSTRSLDARRGTERTLLPGDLGSSEFHVFFGDIWNHRKITFMGALDVHNGRWGMFTDSIFGDVGGAQSRTHHISIGSIATGRSHDY